MGAESSVALADEAATLRLGAALADGIGPGRVLHLSGELGSGKTTLVRGLLRELGHTGPVRSPTYPLVELYVVSRLNLYHFDFYRFKDQSEWQESGLREHFGPHSACVVEWPARAGPELPPPDLALRLAIEGEGRRAWLSAPTPAGAHWQSRSLARFSSAT